MFLSPPANKTTHKSVMKEKTVCLMNKYFYSGFCALSIFALYILSILHVSLHTLVSVGLCLIVCLAGLILFRLEELSTAQEHTEDELKLFIARADFRLKLLHDDRMDNVMNEAQRSKHDTELLKVLMELSRKLEAENASAPEGQK